MLDLLFQKTKNNGVSLMELLIATLITVMVTVAVIGMFLLNLYLSDINKDNTLALAHLSTMMERIKCTAFNNILANFPDGVVDGAVSNGYATIVGGYTLIDEHIVVSYVDPGSDPLEVIVNINWRDARGINHTNSLVTKRTR